MADKRSQGRVGYSVLCAWCERVIRHDGIKESRGMYLECYARMLHDYNRRASAPTPRRMRAGVEAACERVHV